MGLANTEAIRELLEWFKEHGQLGGITKILKIELSTVIGTYIDGHSIGGAIPIFKSTRGNGIDSGILQSASIIFEDSLIGEKLEIHLFTGKITALDNATFNPSEIDISKKIPGKVLLNPLNNLTVFDTRHIFDSGPISLPYQIDHKEELYMVIIARERLDFTTTNGIKVNLGLLLD